jgi:hypothetical protein
MPKIPVTDNVVDFRGAMQPTSSGGGYSAVGDAVKGLGNALGNVASAFDAKTKEEDDFQDKLAELNWLNQQTEQSIKQRNEWSGDNPDGTALSWHGKRTESFNNDLMPKMRTDEGRKRAQLRFASTGHNFYESDLNWEYGKRGDKLFNDTHGTILNTFRGIDLADPANLEQQVAGTLAGIDAIIARTPLPEGRRQQLAKDASDFAITKMRETYEKAGKIDEFYPAMERIIRSRGIDPANPPREAPTTLGAGASIAPASGGHSVVQSQSGAKFRVSTDYAQRFAGLISDLEAAGVKIDASQSGGFADRNIAGTNTKSRHAFGEAIDLNWNENARGKEGKIRDVMPAEKIREIAAKHGLKWGGDWRNPDDMHFEVDRSVNYRAPPVAQRGITAFAGLAPRGDDGIAPKLTAYAPQAGGALAKMEGGYASSRPGPDGKAIVRTLEDMQQGKSDYITIAGDPSQYGKSYTIPEITWIDSKGQQHTSKNVRAVVHDTGSAFKGAGDGKFDIPVARDLTNAQMNAQPFLRGGVKFMLGGSGVKDAKAANRSGLITSLDDAPTPDEIAKSGAGIVDFDLSVPGAKEAVAAAKKAGAKVSAYHEGAGGGASWGEANRDLTKPAELKKLAADAKKLAAQGADYLHVDNLHDLKPDQLAAVAKAVKESGPTMIAKNNPAAWVEIVKKNPDLKPPYAVIEHGMKDKAQVAAAKQLADMGVPVHFIEFGDPGTDKSTRQKRKDPTSTHEEADAFVKANPWAQVTHMKTQDAYNGREAAGGKVFRAEGQVPTADAGRPIRVADAGPFRLPSNIGGGHAERQFLESAIRHLPQYAKEHEAAQARWAKGIEGRVKTIMDNAEKGVIRDQDVSELEALVASKPDVAKRMGVDQAPVAVKAYTDDMREMRLMSPTQLQAAIQGVDQAIKSAPVSPETVASALKRKDRMTTLLRTMQTELNEDPNTWADKVGIMPLRQLDFSSDEKLTESMAERVANAKTVAAYFAQTGHAMPVKFFTKAERDQFSDQLKVGGDKMLGLLGTLHRNFGPEALQAVAEISKQAPEAATVGWMMTAGHSSKLIDDAAKGIERQQKRALGEKMVVPPKVADTRVEFVKAFGTTFARTPMSEAAVTETVNAIYEVRAQRHGWDKPKPEEWAKIAKEVVGENADNKGTYGGVQKVNGNRVVLPVNVKNDDPWLSAGTFSQLLGALRQEDLIDAMGSGPATASNTPLSIGAVRRATPISVGYGRYMLAQGDVSDDNALLRDGTGKPFVLDLLALEKKLKARRPDLYRGYEEPLRAGGVFGFGGSELPR